MKIDIPFNGSRNRVLAKIYHVQPRPVLRPARPLTGKEYLRVFAASVLLAVLVTALLILWPIGERVSR